MYKQTCLKILSVCQHHLNKYVLFFFITLTLPVRGEIRKKGWTMNMLNSKTEGIFSISLFF